MMYVLRLFKDLDRNLAVLSLFGLIGLVLAQVSARVFFSAPLVGMEELVKYFLICIVLLAGAYTARTSGHIRMDELVAWFPPTLRFSLRLLALVATAVVMAVATYSSVLVTSLNLDNRTATLSIPYWIFFLPNNIGFFLMTVQYSLMSVVAVRRLVNRLEVL